MTIENLFKRVAQRAQSGWLLLFISLALTCTVYWPGLFGYWLFDDYPNIVDNKAVQPQSLSLPSLINAALSSPASEFKRPLASLSFAANYLATGLNPHWMKLTNLTIHLLNGLLVFLLAKALLQCRPKGQHLPVGVVAALIAASWLLLPINLTAVLYVVQRMESIANGFVLLGLIGYVIGRQRMLTAGDTTSKGAEGCIWLCAASITVPLAIGILAKETAVMLPLYALMVEWILFSFHRLPASDGVDTDSVEVKRPRTDWRLITLFLLVLILPMIVGLTWELPGLLAPKQWSTRDFTLGTRLLSETRVIVDYIVWSILPTPHALSFYHDNFQVSTGLLKPWTTLASIMALTFLLALMLWLRRRQPLAALGIALFLSCQLLTGTILPLELIYEHRNYFASFGLLLAIVPLLSTPRIPYFALSRYLLLAGLMLCWATLTALTAYAWGDPLRLAEDLADRAPESPRAQYELGRTYIIYSRYDPESPMTQLAYTPLEKSAALANSSILPEQALIFMNSRMHLPLKDAWWDSLIGKLKARAPTVQDESSLAALTQCAREHDCDLPRDRMIQAFLAALSHPNPSARLLSNYGDYAWNVLDDKSLGLRMGELAVKADPKEPVYRITLIRMLLVEGKINEARAAFRQLQPLNYGGRLDSSLKELKALPEMQ